LCVSVVHPAARRMTTEQDQLLRIHCFLYGKAKEVYVP
jgi:hypothetical protein